MHPKGVKVEAGFLAAEARRLNAAWFHWTDTGRPWVIAKAACSLDGKIATAGGESQWLTGEAARAYGHRLRHRVDAILVGIDTVLADDPQLTTRLPRGRGQDPIRLVLDSRLRMPLTARLLHLDSPAPTWVACTTAAPQEKIRAIKDLGAEVLVFPRGSRPGPPETLAGTPGPRSRCRACWWKAAPRSWGPASTRAWSTSSTSSSPPKSWAAGKPRASWGARG